MKKKAEVVALALAMLLCGVASSYIACAVYTEATVAQEEATPQKGDSRYDEDGNLWTYSTVNGWLPTYLIDDHTWRESDITTDYGGTDHEKID